MNDYKIHGVFILFYFYILSIHDRINSSIAIQ